MAMTRFLGGRLRQEQPRYRGREQVREELGLFLLNPLTGYWVCNSVYGILNIFALRPNKLSIFENHSLIGMIGTKGKCFLLHHEEVSLQSQLSINITLNEINCSVWKAQQILHGSKAWDLAARSVSTDWSKGCSYSAAVFANGLWSSSQLSWDVELESFPKSPTQGFPKYGRLHSC